MKLTEKRIELFKMESEAWRSMRTFISVLESTKADEKLQAAKNLIHYKNICAKKIDDFIDSYTDEELGITDAPNNSQMP